MAQTLTAFCDLRFCPVSFDFVTWLVRAMLERDRAKCESLHVVIVPNEGGLGGFARHWGEHDEYATRWRFWHIVVASCPLARATVTVAASRKQAEKLTLSPFWWPNERCHFVAPLADAARAGEKIPKLQATEQARRYVSQYVGDKPYVTLTTRNQTTDPLRNSNCEAWRQLHYHLSAKHRVILLEDANDALRQGRGFAELDPDLRMALYEGAQMNVTGANGPSILLYMSDVPYRIFGIGVNANWREHYQKFFHMEFGEQFPWAGTNQRMVYAADSFETMKKELADWDSGTS